MGPVAKPSKDDEGWVQVDKEGVDPIMPIQSKAPPPVPPSASASCASGSGSDKGAGKRMGDKIPGAGTVVQCSQPGCTTMDGWKRFKTDKVYDTDDDTVSYFRTCCKCLAGQRGISEIAAAAAIVEESPAYARQQQKATDFRHAKEHVQQFFPGLGSGKKVYQVALTEFKFIMGELADAIRRKQEHMLLMEKESKRYTECITTMKKCSDPRKARDLLHELDKVFEDEFLAFQGKPDQWRYLSAASYSDEWSSSGTTWFRMWYVCLAGGSDRCFTVLLSKAWGLKKQDPLASGQAWYCRCGSRFRAGWGVVIEVRCRNGDTVYYKAECPDWHKQDIRALLYETKYRPSSPEDLYRKVPQAAPVVGELVEAVDRDAGVFRIASPASYDSLSTLAWNQIFNMI